MSFELTGKLIEKFDTIEVSERFKKREFVVEKEENAGGNVFTETIKFQLVQNKVDLLDPLNVGEELKVSFNIKGNKWERDGKTNYFVNLDAWRLEKAEGGGAGAAAVDQTPWPDEAPSGESETDDLPF